MADRVQDVLRTLERGAENHDLLYGEGRPTAAVLRAAATIIREQQAEIERKDRVFTALADMLAAAVAEPRLTHDYVRGLMVSFRAALRDSEKPNG